MNMSGHTLQLSAVAQLTLRWPWPPCGVSPAPLLSLARVLCLKPRFASVALPKASQMVSRNAQAPTGGRKQEDLYTHMVLE